MLYVMQITPEFELNQECIHWPLRGGDVCPGQGGHTVAKMKFPVFSLCYINFPCVIFMQKLTISSMNKGHITTVLLHTEAYNKLIF